MSSVIVVERPAEGVALVRIDRPERANALRLRDAEELAGILRALGDDPAVRALVLTGSERHFCAGADLGDLDADGVLAHLDRIHRLLRELLAVRTPTIAAMRGAAVGAGLNIALACDLVIAGEHTTASEIFVQRGLTLDFAGSALLVERLGPHRAKELAFFGEPLDQDDLATVANRVVPDDEVLTVALDWASQLAARPPLALSLTKRLVDLASLSLQQAMEREIIAQLAAAHDPATLEELARWHRSPQ